MADTLRFQELMDIRRDAMRNKARAEDELVHMLESFDGTLLQAIGMGLVRPTFPCPPGFYKYCRDKV